MDANLPLFAGYLGNAQGKTWSLSVTINDPDRLLVLASDEEKVTLEAISESAAGTTDGTLRITGEAFLRLVYGRLDDDTTDGAELDSSTVTFGDLLATFPGI